MPGIRKGRDCYEPRTLAVQPDRVLDIRSAVISAALTSFRPHIVIVDRHAFGVDGELSEPLRALRAAKPTIPGELDRALLLDLSSRAGVYDINDASRHEVRERFWYHVARVRLS